jgi:tetratricopeptide (TPR) repeat protein
MIAAVNTPSDSDFRNLLQKAWQQHQAGKLGEAEALYHRLLQSSPADSDARNLIGLLHIQTGRPASAEDHILHALKTDSRNPQSLYNLGMARKDQCKWDGAAEAFSQCVKLAPNNVDAINSLANCLRLAGKKEEAGPWFDRALSLQPGHIGALLNKGMLLNELEQHESAEKLLQRVVAVDASNADAWNDLGVARIRQGKTRAALDAYRNATGHRAAPSKAWLNRGVLEQQFGHLDEAEKSLKQALAADPSLVDAHFHLAHLRTHASTADEIGAMENLFGKEGQTPANAARLAYGLGLALEKTSAYDRAFHFMSEAHRILAGEQRFNLRRQHEKVTDSMAFFDAALFRALAEKGSESEHPVFISGMPRSGTTLAEQILASHAQVHGAGEQTIMAELVQALSAETGFHYPDCVGKAASEHLQNAIGRYTKTVWSGAGDARRIIDTTPMNFMVMGLAAALFPNARFVICKRDPMDNCLSIYRQQLTSPHAYAHDLETLGRYYRLHEMLVDHWVSVLGDRVFVLRYESLVDDSENMIRKLLAFCGLPFDEACVAFHRHDREVKSPSASQVRQPIYSSSIGAWRNYEKHLQPLLKALAG